MRRRVRGDHPSLSADEIREHRLNQIKELAERFLFDLGLLMAGHPSPLDGYVAAPAAQRLRRTLEPFLASGAAMRPNFGEYGELRVQGDLLVIDRAVTARVDFDDHSVRETPGGELQPTERRRMRLALTIDPEIHSILDFSLQRLVAA